MTTIRILPDELKNQIAAGEVIERPSSVVKELVENALDAGATRITVEIVGGGIELVRVLDDGHGVAPEEIPLAFARHATSKLGSAEDLWRLCTLGFRGEALPSIAAVARVKFFSRAKDAATGRRVTLEDGRLIDDEEAGGPVGTEVLVEGLFANTPARLKYLRNKAAEAGRVTELMTALALARPEVAFRYIRDGREILATPGQKDPLGAIQAVFGLEVAGELLFATGSGPGIVVEGYVSRPGLWRANRWQEVFALNGRVVENRVLPAAVERAYGQLLPAKRFPVAVIYLRLEPSLVDVNVHPAKKEVRFAREDDVFRAIHQAVEGALTGKGIASRTAAPYPAYPMAATMPGKPVVQARLDQLDQLGQSVFAAEEARAYHPDGLRPAGPSPRPGDATQAGRGVLGWLGSAPLRFVGQVMRTYLVFVADDKLVLVDQHAAHERIIYEALKKKSAPLLAQELLSPDAVELSPPEWDTYCRVADALRDMGFTLEEFGGRSLLLRAVPVMLGRVRGGSDLREIIAELAACGARYERGLGDAGREEALIRIACKKGAVKAGEELRPEEAEALFSELIHCETPLACPHGRPTAIVLDGRWLGRAFGREGSGVV